MTPWTLGTKGAAIALALGASLAHAQTFLIDLGPTTISSVDATTESPDSNGSTWNNFAPGQFVRLVDTTGAISASTSPLGIGLGATTPLGASGGSNNGLTNPDANFLGDFAIATATQDYIFRFDDGAGAPENLELEVSSLDPTLTYNVRVFGSRVASENRETLYTVTGGNGAQTTNIVTGGPNIGSNGMSFGNDNIIGEVLGVTPTVAGTISVDMTVLQGAFVYLNVLEISVAQPVDIAFTSQPEGQVIDAGGTLVLSATVEATPPGVSLQWERDGVAVADDMRVSGATTDTLTVAQAELADVGVYRLVASSQGVVETSDEAIVGVRGSPLGIADFDNNGALDFFDVVAFLDAFDAAGG